MPDRRQRFTDDMLRPDPNSPHSVEQVIAKLSDILRGLVPEDPRAQRLTRMIRELDMLQKTRTRP